MKTDHVVLLSARNAFLVLLVSLVAVGLYQFLTAGSVTRPVVVLWVVGVVVFYGSKTYYRRRPPGDSP